MIAPRAKISPPQTPLGFVSFDCAGQADPAHRAELAVFFGELQVGRLVREPQLLVLAVARQRVISKTREWP
jgi:hypothetical protein